MSGSYYGGDKARDSIQAALAGYALGLQYEELPANVVHEAKVRIIDTLGALFAGFEGEPCRIARALAADMPQISGATLLGTRLKTSVDMAAFVNATTARFAELTDTYHWPGSAYGHPSDVVMPLVSTAEYARADGRSLITSVVLAYEVYCRFSDVFHNRGFDPSNFACVAVAVGAARLLKLSPDALSHCIALAVTPNVILRQVRVDHLTMFKVAAAGQAGRAGVFAASLAKAGMEGPHLPFEGSAGWCKQVAGEPLVLAAFGGRGDEFRLPVTGLKMRPCAGNTISSALAAEKAAIRGSIGQIERVLVEVYDRAKIASASAEHFWDPQSPETADHSIPYLVAVALIDGMITPRSFDDVRLWDPEVRALTRKVEVVENAEFTQAYGQMPQMHRSRVTVTMRDGRRRVGESGGGDDDLASTKSDAQVEDKFRSLATDALGKERVNEVLAKLWQVERLGDTAEIPAALVFK